MDCDEAGGLLPALVDRELSASEARAVEAHVAGCAGCQAALARLAAGTAAIRAHAEYFRAPDALRARIERALADTARGAAPRAAAPRATWRERLAGWRRAAALVPVGAVLGFALAFALLRLAAPDPLLDELVASHARAQLTRHVFDVASSDQHTVKPWLSSQLDFSPPVRDLADTGYALVGGRLDYLAHRPVGVLVYKRRQHVIDVYVWPVDPGGAVRRFDGAAGQGYNAIAWTDADLNFAAISDLDAAELRSLTEQLRAR